MHGVNNPNQKGTEPMKSISDMKRVESLMDEGRVYA